jgi:hypothetical protein
MKNKFLLINEADHVIIYTDLTYKYNEVTYISLKCR